MAKMKWFYWIISGLMCALLIGLIVLEIWANIYYWNTPISEVPRWVLFLFK